MVSRRVRRRRRQFTTVGILALLLLIYFAFFSGGGAKSPPPEAVHKAHDTVDVKSFPRHSPLNPDWEGDGKQVTFGFGGDVHFAGSVGNNLAQNPATALGTTIPQLFTGTQLRMVNLETAVTDGTCPEPQNKPYIFDAPASAITALKSAQITLVTEANDHGEDCGPQGLSQNLSVAAQAGYPIIGIGNNAAQAFTPYRVTIDGQRIAIIAATQVIADNLVPTWTATATTGGRRLGHRSHRIGPRSPAGPAERRHRDRLRPLGHRDAIVSQPAARAPGRAARPGGRRRRDRL